MVGIAEEEPAEDKTTEAKDGEVEVLVYLPGSCCPSLLMCALKTAGDVVGNECMLREGTAREVGVGVASEEWGE